MSICATFAHPSPPETAADPTLAWYLEGEALAASLRDGVVLAAAVRRLGWQLPAGPITLFARGPAGIAIAGACAASRADPTRWEELNLGRQQGPLPDAAILVEPVALGSGMRRLLARRWPQLRVIDGLVAASDARTLAA